MSDEMTVVAAMEAYDVVVWLLGACRENGIEDWDSVEEILRGKPDCTDAHVKAVRAAWEMRL